MWWRAWSYQGHKNKAGCFATCRLFILVYISLGNLAIKQLVHQLVLCLWWGNAQFFFCPALMYSLFWKILFCQTDMMSDVLWEIRPVVSSLKTKQKKHCPMYSDPSRTLRGNKKVTYLFHGSIIYIFTFIWTDRRKKLVVLWLVSSLSNTLICVFTSQSGWWSHLVQVTSCQEEPSGLLWEGCY